MKKDPPSPSSRPVPQLPTAEVKDILEALKEEFGFSCNAEDLSNPTALLVEQLSFSHRTCQLANFAKIC